VGALRGVLNHEGAYMYVGTAWLRPGIHRVTIAVDDDALWPGSGTKAGEWSFLGPLALSPTPQQRSVTYLPPARWRDLCGKTLDWVEAIAPQPAAG